MYHTLSVQSDHPRLTAAVQRHLSRHGIRPGTDFTLHLIRSDLLPRCGFRLTISGPTATVTAATQLGLFAGAGRFLRTIRLQDDAFAAPTTDVTFTPQKEIIGTYFATHFDNYYMHAPLPELAAYLEELAMWGQNTLLVWFDMHAYTGMDDPAAAPVIRRLREILSSAREIGMKIGFTALANEGFSTTPQECLAEWAAQNGYHSSPCGHYHVEVCPSKMGGLDLLLRNRRDMLAYFGDLAPDFFSLWPYDQGGCTCAGCAPWGSRGYLSLLGPLRDLIRQFAPDATLACVGWDFDHFTSGEWDGIFAADPAVFNGYHYLGGISTASAHLPASIQKGSGPAGLGTLGFPEISMRGCTPWGGFGANPYPAALQTEWDVTGYSQAGAWSYSEGIFDDCNKAVILSMHTGECATAIEALSAYGRMYFSHRHGAAIAEALTLMETTLPRYVAKNPDRHAPDRVILENPTNVQRVYELVTRVDGLLPTGVRESWRWRLVRIRALADKLLLEADGYITDECDGLLGELESLYHTDEATLYTVMPATRHGLKKRFDDPHREYYL